MRSVSLWAPEILLGLLGPLLGWVLYSLCVHYYYSRMSFFLPQTRVSYLNSHSPSSSIHLSMFQRFLLKHISKSVIFKIEDEKKKIENHSIDIQECLSRIATDIAPVVSVVAVAPADWWQRLSQISGYWNGTETAPVLVFKVYKVMCRAVVKFRVVVVSWTCLIRPKRRLSETDVVEIVLLEAICGRPRVGLQRSCVGLGCRGLDDQPYDTFVVERAELVSLIVVVYRLFGLLEAIPPMVRAICAPERTTWSGLHLDESHRLQHGGSKGHLQNTNS
ncbi:hypothetical protein Tco_0642488 [Tanacetum coccineum]